MHAEEEEEDKSFVFDLFATPDKKYEIMELNFSNMPTFHLRGQLECSNSTGLGMWKGADVMCDFLTSRKGTSSNATRTTTTLNTRAPWCGVARKRVLELGAGVGLCSLVALYLGATKVCCTDGDSNVLENLRYNISQNVDPQQHSKEKKSGSSQQLTEKISVHQLIWGHHLDEFMEAHGPFDVIIATDCVYITASLRPLWQTVHSLLDKNGVFVFANECASQASLEEILGVAREFDFYWDQAGQDEKVHLFSKTKKM